MEVKKNPKADLTRKTGLFFSIALVVTMSLVLSAFEWKHYEERIDELVQRNSDVFEQEDVPVTEILQPLPPVPSAPEIVEVKDDEPFEEIKINLDIETTTETVVAPVEIMAVEEKENVDEIVLFPESNAAFEGGLGAFYKYVSDEVKYPAQARRIEREGKVFVEFVINRDGSVTDIKVIKGIGAGCDEEAIRVIQKSPKWTPGKQRGKPVRQRMVLPINFQLSR